jgi:Rrf2 family protein
VAINVNARIDYAVRAAVELAGSSREAPRKLHDLSAAQAIPPAFLADILGQLRHAGVVGSQRGTDGGYWLARPADELNLGEVMRAVEGSLVEVRGQAPDDVEYVGPAVALQQVWIILRDMLELVTIADVAAGELPPSMVALARAAESRG